MPDYYSTHTGQQIDASVGEVVNAGGAVSARLIGNGEPTSTTAARVGDLYTDTSTDGKMYRCIRVNGSTYTWDVVGSGDGVSPEAEVERITGGAKITITDSRGTTTADINDGVSPSASVEQAEGGAVITVVDAEGTTTATINDGVSPAASVEEVEGGAEITIIDKDGTTIAVIHNGYHVGRVALTSGGTGSGQTATYTMYLNNDEDDPTAVGTFSVYNGSDGTGAGDMTKAVYDTNNNGKVDNADNADKLGNNPPEYYAATSDIPAWAMESTKPTYTAAEVGATAQPLTAISFPTSGTALADNTIYTVSTAVTTYQFVPPTGWAHGTFSTGSSVNITFATGSKFYGEAPTFEASTEYEFDVNGGIWVFGEVVTS